MKKEKYPDGREIIRDESGKIVTTKLPKSVASRMGKVSGEKRVLVENDVDSLLRELGLDEESVSARLLAEQFARGGSNAVGAARELFKMSRGAEYSPTASVEAIGHYIPPRKGERCPRCGIYNLSGDPLVTQQNLIKLLKLFDKEWNKTEINQNEEKPPSQEEPTRDHRV